MEDLDEPYDSDCVDPELEASLYAKIFHRELNWWQSTQPSDCQNPAAKAIKSVITTKSSFFVDEYDSDIVQEIGIGEGSKPPSLNVSSNVDGVDEVAKDRRSLRKRLNKKRNKKRFQDIPRSEWAAEFSVAEIQHFLGSSQGDWRISVEDTDRTIGSRYFSREKKFQTLHCRRCDQFGHFKKHCKVKIRHCCTICSDFHDRWCVERRFCILCFEFGHMAFKCKKPQNGRLSLRKVNCQRCRHKGHPITACPEQWRQFHSTTSPSDIPQLKQDGLLPNARCRSRKIYCYNCGLAGHFGHECRKPTAFEGRLICFNPTVSRYDTAVIDPSNNSPAAINSVNGSSSSSAPVNNNTRKGKRPRLQNRLLRLLNGGRLPGRSNFDNLVKKGQNSGDEPPRKRPRVDNDQKSSMDSVGSRVRGRNRKARSVRYNESNKPIDIGSRDGDVSTDQTAINGRPKSVLVALQIAVESIPPARRKKWMCRLLNTLKTKKANYKLIVEALQQLKSILPAGYEFVNGAEDKPPDQHPRTSIGQLPQKSIIENSTLTNDIVHDSAKKEMIGSTRASNHGFGISSNFSWDTANSGSSSNGWSV